MSATRKTRGPMLALHVDLDSLRIESELGVIELPLSQTEDGALAAPTRDAVAAGLGKLSPWRRGPRPCVCYLPARGVSLRSLRLPPAPPAELERLIHLQMEKELPLPVGRLALAWQASSNGNGELQHVTVALLRRELVDDLGRLLKASGLEPSFRLAALARQERLPAVPGVSAHLHVGSQRSELLLVEDGAATSVRVVPWGAQSPGNPTAWVLDALHSLAGAEARTSACQVLLTGETAGVPDLAAAMNSDSHGRLECTPRELAAETPPAATAPGAAPPAAGQFAWQQAPAAAAPVSRRRWRPVLAGLAVIAVLGAFVWIRYVSLIHRLPAAERRLAGLEAERRVLPVLDADLSFFAEFAAAQPEYLDAIGAIAQAAPGGTMLESLTVNRQGEIAIRGTMIGPEAPNELRKKLAGSPGFAAVVLDEQSAPQGDEKRVTFRLRAGIEAPRAAADGGPLP